MVRMLRSMTMYSMSFDNGVIEGLGSGLIMQQVIVELAKREDYPEEDHPVGFEQMLEDEWAAQRSDIYEQGIYPSQVVGAAQPIRPQRVLERLKVTQSGLVELLRSGRLRRPGKLGHGRVAWRLDEVEALVAPRDWGS
jgi:predicted DNA-binding transcriptional regulator AlpA